MESRNIAGKNNLNKRLTKKVIKLQQENKILVDALTALGVDVPKLLMNKRESKDETSSEN